MVRVFIFLPGEASIWNDMDLTEMLEWRKILIFKKGLGQLYGVADATVTPKLYLDICINEFMNRIISVWPPNFQIGNRNGYSQHWSHYTNEHGHMIYSGNLCKRFRNIFSIPNLGHMWNHPSFTSYAHIAAHWDFLLVCFFFFLFL